MSIWLYDVFNYPFRAVERVNSFAIFSAVARENSHFKLKERGCLSENPPSPLNGVW